MFLLVDVCACFMTRTVLLGTTIAALLAISIVGVAAAVESWQGLDSDSVVDKNTNSKVLSVDATDTVPHRTSTLAGFAWLYADGPNTAFAITTHNANVDDDPKNEVRDSNQNPDGWHAHNVVLAAGTADSTFCVAEIADAPTAGIAIEDDKIDVNVRNSALTGELGDLAAAFTINVDGGCPNTLGTEVTEAGPLSLGISVHALG